MIDQPKRRALTRLRSALITLSLVLGGIEIGTEAAVAVTNICVSPNYGFSCVSFTGYSGQSTWGYPVDGRGHNCTNYAAYRLAQNGAGNPGNLGNAYEWDNNARAKGFVVDGNPVVGSIAQWESNHVAYVEAVTSTYVEITDDSYGGTTTRTRYLRGQSDWPSSFIHIKDAAMPSSPWQWHLRNWNSDGPASTAFSYGSYASDHPITGDWDGDGTYTPGIVRAVNGQWEWHLRNDNSDGGAFVSFTFGVTSDNPIVGDWDGDGTMTPGITRSVNGELQWHLKNVNDGGGAYTSFNYGASTDNPVVGDWDGNGTFTPGIVRSVSGEWQWHLRSENSGGGAYVSFGYGAVATDHPKIGDWDGDGTYTPGIVRNSGGVWQWHLRNFNSGGGASLSFSFGSAATDMPIVGDWDGNGTVSAGINRAG